MNRFLFVAAAASIAAVYFGHANDAALLKTPMAEPALASSSSALPVTPVSEDPPGQASIQAQGGGHFLADFKVNGHDINGLVDTGATFVAINEQTARRLGISGSELNYRYAVTTANGSTQAAHVTLSRMELGSVRVRDVDAFVLKDKSLSGMLVGMSFLSKLKSYKVEDGMLILKN